MVNLWGRERRRVVRRVVRRASAVDNRIGTVLDRLMW